MKTQTSVYNRIGVIFDLDGVLVDTGWAHRQAWFALAQKEGLHITDDFFYSTFGMPNDRIIPMLLGRNPSSQQLNRLSDWKEQFYRQLISDELTLDDDIESLLTDLKRIGFRLAIGSSAPKANLDFIRERLGLDKYFDAYVTCEDVTEGKPSPQTFLKAAEKLSIPPASCVVVEDAVQGVEAGKAAGIAVVAVTTTRSRADLAKADLIFDSLAEIKAEDFIKLLTSQNR